MVAYEAARHLGGALRTFTVSVADEELDEAPVAAAHRGGARRREPRPAAARRATGRGAGGRPPLRPAVRGPLGDPQPGRRPAVPRARQGGPQRGRRRRGVRWVPAVPRGADAGEDRFASRRAGRAPGGLLAPRGETAPVGGGPAAAFRPRALAPARCALPRLDEGPAARRGQATGLARAAATDDRGLGRGQARRQPFPRGHAGRRRHRHRAALEPAREDGHGDDGGFAGGPLAVPRPRGRPVRAAVAGRRSVCGARG